MGTTTNHAGQEGGTRTRRDRRMSDLWGQSKLMALTGTAEAEPAALCEDIEPVMPFAEVAANRDWTRMVIAVRPVPQVISGRQDKS